MRERMLIIANPAARSGEGKSASGMAHLRLSRLAERNGWPAPVLRLTEGPGDGKRLAGEQGSEFDAVIALGGDGIVHEVVNGLMELPEAKRPVLGVVPCGHGDDFARTLGFDRNPSVALKQLETAHEAPLDLGNVNGQWFDETLSFGLDAAIALETVTLRDKTRRTGTILYLQSGLDQLLHHLDKHKAALTFDDDETVHASVYMLAIQNGPTYGSGFKITPKASCSDGMLDVCWAEGNHNLFSAGVLFAKAKEGGHIGKKGVHVRRCKSVRVKFDSPVPCQVDGEPLDALTFEVGIEPAALTVLSALD